MISPVEKENCIFMMSMLLYLLIPLFYHTGFKAAHRHRGEDPHSQAPASPAPSTARCPRAAPATATATTTRCPTTVLPLRTISC